MAALLASALAVASGREPVLKQVDLPHNYYWRELYLPQLTTGPGSVSFMPDGETLVYSMGGSLWRQRIGEDEAVELTHAIGAYDHQPDVARGGRSVVFTRYDGNAMALWRMDLATGQSRALTRGGSVNVEPRLSPDGKRIAWVSTEGSGHFNLFLADIGDDGLRNARPLLGERRSKLDRYYYSAFDHAINPSWSPDGKSLLYVGNPEIAWGTGDIRMVQVDAPAQSRKLLSEETSWSTRPELAPDGHRILFASYHGRQTHQLWMTTVDGAAPLPLTFGTSERRNARWSPDGKRIAYIGNAGEGGNTELVVMDVVGGASRIVTPTRLRTLAPTSRMVIDVRDGAGQRVPARVSVVGSDRRAHGLRDAWMHADDGFDRATLATEAHYFHCASPCTLDVPAGVADVTVQHGFAHALWQQRVEAVAGRETPVQVALVAQPLPREFGHFVGVDLHVHMNYAGHYRNTPANLARQAQAEDLDVVENLIVNKEERIPDIAYFGTPTGDTHPRIAHAQEYHTSFWGHLGLLNLRDHYVTPDFSAYRHTAMASPWPHNGVVADLAHAQQGVVGYVHPFDTVPDPAKDPALTHQLPADVAQGKVDYIEIVGFADHKSTANVWYRLLNLGYRLPAGAGSDTMANYASLRGPVGINRVFLDTDGRLDGDAVMTTLKAGRGFVTNGPLLGLLVDGQKPGASIAARGKLPYRVSMRSPIAVDHLELVSNGEVVKRFDLAGDRMRFDVEGELDATQGGWLLLRAWNDDADPKLLDLYPYATTNPVWLEGDAPDARGDAAYFVAWLDRVIEAADARDDWNDAQEEAATLQYLREAQDKFRQRAEER
ncbi:CehA/McbA family metallohydrolase [Lysobacter sp. A6]|uniref:CehA/McbA family metallohydrolase n=1 Tax=Noviluteimonas lactosilytica TaxID=2888523 RepID=A0ABS8JGT3_9GAMM|nr:CehA/McbA family metallohydrolase [Lysobacter lactosilyticus]